MSARLRLRLVDAMAATPAGSVASVDVDGPGDLDVVEAWAAASGNTVVLVHADRVELMRGRPADPVAALPPERRPGHRLWIYTNFHCNLACDYCCVESSPRADPRIIGLDEFAAVVDEAVDAGVRELFVTGGEPFLLVDLDQRLGMASVLPTTVLTNAMVWSGERRRRLEVMPREGITLQISIDSPDSELHDRHRGDGSFRRAMEGVELAMGLGFRLRVAATLGPDAGDAEERLVGWFDELGLAEDQRVIRRVARQGAANAGLVVSRASLLPEVCVTASGLWWHPVAALDPSMQVASSWRPLAGHIDAVRDEYRRHRIAGDVLASSFPCA